MIPSPESGAEPLDEELRVLGRVLGQQCTPLELAALAQAVGLPALPAALAASPDAGTVAAHLLTTARQAQQIPALLAAARVLRPTDPDLAHLAIPPAPTSALSYAIGAIQAQGDAYVGSTHNEPQYGGVRVQNLYLAEGWDRVQRDKLLHLVDRFWVQRVLAPAGAASLPASAANWLPLGKQVQPALPVPPTGQVIPHPADHPGTPVPAETSILSIFAQLGSLLILGAPGAGKTIALYDLAHSLVAQAYQDPTRPVPVIVNLSSWPVRRLPLHAWLIAELQQQYKIPPGLSDPWLRAGRLLPLLDGLDEVASADQAACVATLNAFPYALSGLVVCCRSGVYDSLPILLTLGGSVTLAPLTPEQIDTSLAGQGAAYAGLRQALREDSVLQELATSPLLFTMLRTVYQEARTLDPAARASPEDRQAELLTRYVQILLERIGRTPDRQYSPAQIQRWLAWLARHLAQDNQTIFLIEQLQPRWLDSRAQRWVYLIGSRTLVGAILAGTFWLVSAMHPFESLFRLLGFPSYVGATTSGSDQLMGVLNSLVSCLVIAIFAILRLERRQPVDSPPAGRPDARFLTRYGSWVQGLIVGLAVTLTTVLVVGRLVPAISDWTLGSLAIFQGVLYGIGTGIIFNTGGLSQDSRQDIYLVEAFHWSWAAAWAGVRAQLRTFVGLLVLLLAVELGAVLGGVLPGVATALGANLFATLVILEMVLLRSGLRRREIPAQVRPNQGIRQALRNGALVASSLTVGTAIAALVANLLLSPGVAGVARDELAPAVIGFLVLTLLFGIIGGLTYGWVAVIQHITLRLLLLWVEAVPARYAEFLNYAAAQLLLQRIGGGYRFIHSLVLARLATPGASPVTPILPAKDPAAAP